MEINTYFLNYAVPAHTKTRKITGLLAKWRGVCLVNLLRESTKAERFLSQRFNNPALKARWFPFGPKISIDIFFFTYQKLHIGRSWLHHSAKFVIFVEELFFFFSCKSTSFKILTPWRLHSERRYTVLCAKLYSEANNQTKEMAECISLPTPR